MEQFTCNLQNKIQKACNMYMNGTSVTLAFLQTPDKHVKQNQI